jgi:hypothetical protein
MNWVHDPQRLLEETGAHRFIWDLHRSLPEGMRQTAYLAAGPWVVPGSYTVKLTAGGKVSARPLLIKPDPRSKTTYDGLQRQSVLASQLIEDLAKVSSALEQAGNLQKQIEERKKDAANKADTLKALQDLDRKVEVAAEPDGDDDSQMFGLTLPEKEHEPLPNVQSALMKLFAILENADAAPSSDVSVASEKWQAISKDALAQWKMVQEQDLVETNAKLQKAKLKPLALK